MCNIVYQSPICGGSWHKLIAPTNGTENRDNGTDNRKTGVCSIVADLQRLMGQADQDLALRCRQQYGPCVIGTTAAPSL
jgi:hypothetical protein